VTCACASVSGFGVAIGLGVASMLGRPALHTCRTQYPRQREEMRLWTDRRICSGFCYGPDDQGIDSSEARSDRSGYVGQWGGCDWDACREALNAPCEELSGRQCLPLRECRSVAY
jgi:hypothetical protein